MESIFVIFGAAVFLYSYILFRKSRKAGDIDGLKIYGTVAYAGLALFFLSGSVLGGLVPYLIEWREILAWVLIWQLTAVILSRPGFAWNQSLISLIIRWALFLLGGLSAGQFLGHGNRAACVLGAAAGIGIAGVCEHLLRKYNQRKEKSERK